MLNNKGKFGNEKGQAIVAIYPAQSFNRKSYLLF